MVQQQREATQAPQADLQSLIGTEMHSRQQCVKTKFCLLNLSCGALRRIAFMDMKNRGTQKEQARGREKGREGEQEGKRGGSVEKRG